MTIQPLQAQIPIVDENGKISPYFLRFLRENGLGVEGAIEDAATASDEAAAALAATLLKADKTINLTAGTGLSGGGDLSADRSFSLDASIDDLNDVDTTTTPPTDAQALIWDNASSLWIPGDVASGGGGGGGGGGSGAFEFIEEITVTAQTTVDIDLPTGYASYYLEPYFSFSFDGSGLWLRVTDDGFSTVKTTSGDYRYVSWRYNSGSALDRSAADTKIELTSSVGNAAPEHFQTQIEILNSQDTAYTGVVAHNQYYTTATVQTGSELRGMYMGTQVLNGVRLMPTNGNVTGIVRVWGRKAVASGGGGGAVTLLESLSPSSVSSVDIESFAGLGYKKIVIDSDLKFSTDGVTATARFKLNGTYKSSDYRSAVQQASSSGSTTNSSSAAGTQLFISGTGGTWGIGNDTLESYCSSLEILNPDGTVLGKKVIGKGSHGVPSGQQATCAISGHYEGTDFTNALEGIRILASSGTFTGTINVWGYS